MKATTKLNVLVLAAPEVEEEWTALYRLLRELNHGTAREFGVSLKTSRFDFDSRGQNTPDHVTGVGANLDDCDILIGIFWKSFSASIDLEHYRTSIENYRPRAIFLFKQLVYIPSSSKDARQWIEMLKFRQSFPADRVWWPYREVAQATSLVREQITQYLVDTFSTSKSLKALTTASDRRLHKATTTEKPLREQMAASLRAALKSPHGDSDNRIASEHQGAKEDISDKPIREQMIAGLSEALKSPHNFVRNAAIDALGETKLELAVKPLASMLDDPDMNIRSRAAAKLGGIPGHLVVSAFSVALKSSYSDVRLEAAKILRKSGGLQAVPSLTAALRHGSHDIRRLVALALGGIGGDSALSVLARALKHPDRDLRRCALDGLKEMASKGAIVALTNAVNDKDYEIRQAAVEALGELGGDLTIKGLGDEAALSGLYKAIRSPHSDVRRQVVKALAASRSKETVSALVKATKDESPEVRAQAVESLRSAVGSDQAVTSIIKALRDKSKDVRGTAAKALEKMFGRKPIPIRSYSELKAPEPATMHASRVVTALIKSSKDGDPDVRGNAIEALGAIGGQQAIEALIDILRFHHGDVRLQAAEALGQIGTEHAVGALVSAFQDIGREKALEESGAYIAHEVRSAIGPLRMTAKELNRALSQPGINKTALVEIIDRVVRRTDEIYLLVNRYVNYTRPLSPKLKLTNVNQLIKDTLKEFYSECMTQGISISQNLQNIGRVRVDPILIGQALRNVFRNALEALGGEGEMLIVTRAEQDHVVISITDTGPGIQPKNLARLFELGFTTKFGKQGAGLGLKLARRIVEEGHNGQLLVDNAPRRGGLVVTIKLSSSAGRI